MAALVTQMPTEREPRLVLGVTLERTAAGLPTIADVASAIGAIASLFVAAAPSVASLDVPCTGQGPISVLLAVEQEGESLIISGGEDGTLRSWRLDGQAGPVDIADPEHEPVSALLAVEYEGEPLVISGGEGGTIRSWRLDGRAGPLSARQPGTVWAIAAVENDGEPLVISGGGDGTIRSWRLDGQPGPFGVVDTGGGEVRQIVVIENGDEPIVVAGRDDGTLKSWYLDGRPAPITDGADVGSLRLMAPVAYQDETVLLTGGWDGTVRSNVLDGGTGPIALNHVPRGSVWIVAPGPDGAPTVVSGGWDGSIRSQALDGTPGSFTVIRAHNGPVWALLAVQYRGHAVIVSGGRDGSLRSWWVSTPKLGQAVIPGPPPWTLLGGPIAGLLEVRQLSLASPLEIQLHVPGAVLAAPAVFGFVLYAIKRVWGYPIEVRSYLAERRRQLLEAELECERLEAGDEVAETQVSVMRGALPADWKMTDAVLIDDDE